MWAKRALFFGVSILGLSFMVATLLSGSPAPREAPPREATPLSPGEAGIHEIASMVDQQFAAKWAKLEMQAAAPADDLTIMRRLALGLTGSVPSLEEIRAFEAANAHDPTQWRLSRLFEDRRFSDYLAERLARAYVGTEDGPFIMFRRHRFVTWLSDRLQENQPYDVIVRSLIADAGLWTDTPAVNFLSVTIDQDAEQEEDKRPDEIRLAGRTTRAFLGMRLDCVQCHDDQFGDHWKQTHFHELAAFYGHAQSSLMGISDTLEQDYKYQYLRAETEEVVAPSVPFEAELLPEETEGVTQRQRLAAWVTHKENKPFARAMVNRMWAIMFGQPLVQPIDDLPLEGPFPPGLETLAADFAEHDFNLQRLIRTIAATRVYQLDSRADFEPTIKHEDQWAVFPLTRLRPEQVAGAMMQSSTLRTANARSHVVFRIIKFFQKNDFIQRYGDTGEDEFEDRGGTIPQRLLMLNGNLIKERTKNTSMANAASRISALAPDDRTAVEMAYLTVLTRRPEEEESAYFAKKLAGLHGDQRAQGMEDIAWTLLNSSEFSWNH